MKYPYLLFDADDTLFDFPRSSARAFSIMCRLHNIPDTPEVFQLYFQINQDLWDAFDRGEVTKEFISLERYVRFLRMIGSSEDPVQCDADYSQALGECVFPLPHAEEVCQALWDQGHQLYIITNATASVQRSRLKNSVFSRFITDTFISEDAGAAKPSIAYYEYVRRRLPDLTAENGLVIGDSLTTDILGANNAGLPCCWFNPSKKARPSGLRINYEIADLRQLLEIVS